ncbi:hypothetical protein PR048_006757 [Dryococelus australis]|uniref:Uncharacterized protein n=1 Tax=Dryococelus australis TaxID=614101 RepID=A0ABQ9IBT9_9NEOP|nr:hypothetical protein PR048_006757 [Dryococelus australis]
MNPVCHDRRPVSIKTTAPPWPQSALQNTSTAVAVLNTTVVQKLCEADTILEVLPMLQRLCKVRLDVSLRQRASTHPSIHLERFRETVKTEIMATPGNKPGYSQMRIQWVTTAPSSSERELDRMFEACKKLPRFHNTLCTLGKEKFLDAYGILIGKLACIMNLIKLSITAKNDFLQHSCHRPLDSTISVLSHIQSLKNVSRLNGKYYYACAPSAVGQSARHGPAQLPAADMSDDPAVYSRRCGWLSAQPPLTSTTTPTLHTSSTANSKSAIHGKKFTLCCDIRNPAIKNYAGLQRQAREYVGSINVSSTARKEREISIPAFAWSDFGKPRKTEIRMAGPGISRTRDHPVRCRVFNNLSSTRLIGSAGALQFVSGERLTNYFGPYSASVSDPFCWLVRAEFWKRAAVLVLYTWPFSVGMIDSPLPLFQARILLCALTTRTVFCSRFASSLAHEWLQKQRLHNGYSHCDACSVLSGAGEAEIPLKNPNGNVRHVFQCEYPVDRAHQLRRVLKHAYLQLFSRLRHNLGSDRVTLTHTSDAPPLRHLVATLLFHWGRGKLESPEKTRRPEASTGTIPYVQKPGSDPARNLNRFAFVGDEQPSHWATATPLVTRGLSGYSVIGTHREIARKKLCRYRLLKGSASRHRLLRIRSAVASAHLISPHTNFTLGGNKVGPTGVRQPTPRGANFLSPHPYGPPRWICTSFPERHVQGYSRHLPSPAFKHSKTEVGGVLQILILQHASMIVALGEKCQRDEILMESYLEFQVVCTGPDAIGTLRLLMRNVYREKKLKGIVARWFSVVRYVQRGKKSEKENQLDKHHAKNFFLSVENTKILFKCKKYACSALLCALSTFLGVATADCTSTSRSFRVVSTQFIQRVLKHSRDYDNLCAAIISGTDALVYACSARLYGNLLLEEQNVMGWRKLMHCPKVLLALLVWHVLRVLGTYADITNLIRLETASQKKSSDTHKTPYDRVKRCRERKINIKASERVKVDVFPQRRQCPQHSQTIFRVDDCAIGAGAALPECTNYRMARRSTGHCRYMLEQTPTLDLECEAVVALRNIPCRLSTSQDCHRLLMKHGHIQYIYEILRPLRTHLFRLAAATATLLTRRQRTTVIGYWLQLVAGAPLSTHLTRPRCFVPGVACRPKSPSWILLGILLNGFALQEIQFKAMENARFCSSWPVKQRYRPFTVKQTKQVFNLMLIARLPSNRVCHSPHQRYLPRNSYSPMHAQMKTPLYLETRANCILKIMMSELTA